MADGTTNLVKKYASAYSITTYLNNFKVVQTMVDGLQQEAWEDIHHCFHEHGDFRLKSLHGRED